MADYLTRAAECASSRISYRGVGLPRGLTGSRIPCSRLFWHELELYGPRPSFLNALSFSHFFPLERFVAARPGNATSHNGRSLSLFAPAASWCDAMALEEGNRGRYPTERGTRAYLVAIFVSRYLYCSATRGFGRWLGSGTLAADGHVRFGRRKRPPKKENWPATTTPPSRSGGGSPRAIHIAPTSRFGTCAHLPHRVIASERCSTRECTKRCFVKS